MADRAYLDWNATAPLREQAKAALTAALELCGNPSSVHGEGRAARRLIEDAREQVATLVGADPARRGLHLGRNRGQCAGAVARSSRAPATRPRWSGCWSAPIEHPSVRSAGRFAAEAVSEIPVTAQGVVDLEALKAMLGRRRPRAGFGHAGQQRDRRDSADSRGR